MNIADASNQQSTNHISPFCDVICEHAFLRMVFVASRTMARFSVETVLAMLDSSIDMSNDSDDEMLMQRSDNDGPGPSSLHGNTEDPASNSDLDGDGTRVETSHESGSDQDERVGGGTLTGGDGHSSESETDHGGDGLTSESEIDHGGDGHTSESETDHGGDGHRSESETEDGPRRKSRKRLHTPKQWKKNKRIRLRNSGKEYTSISDKQVGRFHHT